MRKAPPNPARQALNELCHGSHENNSKQHRGPAGQQKGKTAKQQKKEFHKELTGFRERVKPQGLRRG